MLSFRKRSSQADSAKIENIELPKIIHFIWAGGSRQMPILNQQRVRDWANKHSEFQIYIWVDYISALGSTWEEKKAYVVSINLKAKIDSLTKELSENKKQLHEAIMTAKVQNRSLLRQNEQLQKIIQEHGLDKLPQLEEGANLQFSNGVAAYGK